jgi:hypothetical protein
MYKVNRLLNVWRAMHNRCYNANHKSYLDYGGRGIVVDAVWHGKEGYEAFLRDMGECPVGGTIERIDGNSNYGPSNCRWASREEQANNKRNNKFYTAHGKTQTLAMWAKELGCTSHAIRLRLKNGMTIEEAVSKPVPERPNSKLTMEQAQAIRAGYPMLSAQKLAAQFGVCKKSVLNILHNKTFAEGVT